MMANLLGYRDIPQNTTVQVRLPKAAHGILVQNNTNVFVFINNDRGALLLNVPPGLTLGWNEPDGVFVPQVGCNGLYQGSGRVYFYDDNLDLSNNPAAQQPPGLVNIGSATVTVASGTIALEPGTSILANDLTVQANTGNAVTNLAALQGLLGSTRINHSINNTFVLDNLVIAITEYIVQVTAIRRAGLLSVQSRFGAGVVFQNNEYSGIYLAGVPKIPFVFSEKVPAGGTMLSTFTGDGDFTMSF